MTRLPPRSYHHPQAMDRVHRLGQTRDVEAFRYIATDSIEERMLELQVGADRRWGDLLRAHEGGRVHPSGVH